MSSEHGCYHKRIVALVLLYFYAPFCVAAFAPLSNTIKSHLSWSLMLREKREAASSNFFPQKSNSTDDPSINYVTRNEDGHYTSTSDENISNTSSEGSPFPTMPSQTFLHLVNSQFELLANSLLRIPPSDSYRSSATHAGTNKPKSKIKSMALYLPQENPINGILEFIPSVVYPCPTSERVFIASDAESGLPPSMPPTLTKLPGFAHPQTLIPNYPFATSSTTVGASAAVGVLEEVLCDVSSSTNNCEDPALSLPLFSGSRTIGVLLVWPSYRDAETNPQLGGSLFWTDDNRHQILRAGETLALALCMDLNMIQTKLQTEQFRVALADSLHQVKNPIQAMRTYSKLLRVRVDQGEAVENSMPQLSALAENIAVTSDRIVDLLLPMDSIVNTLDAAQQQPLLAPKVESDLILRRKPLKNEAVGKEAQKEMVPLTHVKEDFDTEMTYVSDVLKPILSAAKAVALDRQIEFVVNGMGDDEELPGVLLCARMLQEAVMNILDNAIKYVRCGKNGKLGVKNGNAKIRVSLSPNAEPAGVTLCIEDNGPGVHPSERHAVFWRGYRSERIKAATIGSGIGLDISRNLITRMGGTLDIINERDESLHLGGAVMRIILFRDPKN